MLGETLNSFRKYWRGMAEKDGGHCPVCDRWGKVYARILNENMAKSLIWLCREQARTGNDWVDIPNTGPRFVIRSNQLPVLTSWGLVERRPKEKGAKGSRYSGLWRPTGKGWDFYHGTIKVPKKAYAYNNRIEGYSEELVRIDECFETYFDYNQVMKDRFDD